MVASLPIRSWTLSPTANRYAGPDTRGVAKGDAYVPMKVGISQATRGRL